MRAASDLSMNFALLFAIALLVVDVDVVVVVAVVSVVDDAIDECGWSCVVAPRATC